MSFFCEIFFGVKWWDYSGELLNIHGRTCLFYAVSWGLLAIFLIKFVNPYVDNFIDILKKKKIFFKTATAMLIVLFSANALVTSYALKVFYYRISTENNLDIDNKTTIQEKYAKIEKSDDFEGRINQYYDNEKMIKTYPNIMIEEKNDNTVAVESLLKDITPYYFRIGGI